MPYTSWLKGLTIATAVAAATPASAADLIRFADGSPSTQFQLGIDAYGRGGSFGWHQTHDYHDVTLSAAVFALLPGTTGTWFLYSFGVGLVTGGTYLAPLATGIDTFDFNSVPMTTLVSGLSLTAGDYFLMMFGPISVPGNSALLIGDYQGWTANLAPGFSLFGFASSAPDPQVGPVFEYLAPETMLNFAVTGTAVPEPASWAMLIAGFGLTGAVMRRRHSQSQSRRVAA